MPINTGYITANRGTSADEAYTLDYAVKPLLKYLNKDLTVWCPFDLEDSAFVRLLKENGNKIINTHIDLGQDFFEYEPNEDYDIIISNPPYSQKDKILKRLTELGKPYAMLLPLPTLQGQKRFEYLKDTQVLIFDKRINFIQNGKINTKPSFASIYLCKDFLPKDLIFEKI